MIVIEKNPANSTRAILILDSAVWVPAKNHARIFGGAGQSGRGARLVARAIASDGRHDTEEALCAAFAEDAGPMLEFDEEHTPPRFSLIPKSVAGALELKRCANGRRPPIETLGS